VTKPVAPSGERLRGKGRYGLICKQNCVIHTWAPWVWGATTKALHKSTCLYLYLSIQQKQESAAYADTTCGLP